MIRVESNRIAPGVIEHVSPFTQIDLAGSHERINQLAAVLQDAGVDTRVVQDETAALWAKLAFLAPFALLTTRYRLTVGVVRTERREELVALTEEAASVSRACGAPADPAKALALYDSFPSASKRAVAAAAGRAPAATGLCGEEEHQAVVGLAALEPAERGVGEKVGGGLGQAGGETDAEGAERRTVVVTVVPSQASSRTAGAARWASVRARRPASGGMVPCSRAWRTASVWARTACTGTRSLSVGMESPASVCKRSPSRAGQAASC
ncbi:hypothetical protein GCM10023323_22160 [Streptomyces thinghirensis]|uniref:Ketopantoate reductase C-terminal domain-containing protein n=1 Tax=Streptomyces thinghirensis TaxID=551547 RepID=A0ABP9T2G9_9ACTN